MLVQRCANILQHTCLSSNGQSGSSMWDDNQRIRAILTGKVCPIPCLCFLNACLSHYH